MKPRHEASSLKDLTCCNRFCNSSQSPKQHQRFVRGIPPVDLVAPSFFMLWIEWMIQAGKRQHVPVYA